MAIPKIIHQFWISNTNDVIPDDIQKNIQSWSDTHPEYELKLWSLENLVPLLKNFHGLNLLDCINACKFPAMQSDIIRLAVVYEYGGFWSDLKNFILQPFLDDLLQYNKLILSEHWPTGKTSSFTPFLSNSFLGAPKKNTYIFLWLTKAYENIQKRQEKGVVEIAGAYVMMRVIKNEMISDYQLLKETELWNVHIKRRGGSYNDQNQHWSIRQKNESPYTG